MPYKDPSANVACKKAWYQRNKDAIRVRGREYRKVNRERIRESKRNYRLEHIAEKRIANRRWRNSNRSKANQSNRKWRESLGVTERYLRHVEIHYGLPRAAYDALLKRQQGVCAICHQPPKRTRVLDVDHCHKTGVVRGLLCRRCNIAGGFFDSLSDDLFHAAMQYLGKRAI